MRWFTLSRLLTQQISMTVEAVKVEAACTIRSTQLNYICFFMKGKNQCVKMFNYDRKFHKAAATFMTQNPGEELMFNTDEMYSSTLWGNNSLNELTFKQLITLVSKIKCAQLCSLPLTEHVVKQHLKQVYL